MRRSGAPDHIGRMVAVKDRQNAMRNPYAHLHLADIDMKMVEDSMMLWDPLRYLEACPSSDGAAAMVLAAEDAVSGQYPPAWIHGTAMRSEPTMFAGRDQVNPQAGRDCSADVYAQAGITDPREQIDVAEVYVPFSWYEPMWLENLGLLRPGRRVEADRVGGHRLRRRHPLEHLGRRAVVQPHRGLGHAPVPRGGHAGAGPGRRAPGRRGQGWPWARPTAAAPSSSPCGWSGARSPDARGRGRCAAGPVPGGSDVGRACGRPSGAILEPCAENR